MLSDLDSNNDSSNFINNNAQEKLLGKKRKNGKEKHKPSRRNKIKYELEQYPDEEFEKDLNNLITNNKLHNFMYIHFPKAYSKYEILTNIKKLAVKRKQRQIFIPPSSVSTNFYLYKINRQNSNFNSKIPLSLWKPSNEISDEDISKFFFQMKKIWPFEKCPFNNDDILKFLMINNYNTTHCIDNINDCVSFCLNRYSEIITNENSLVSKAKKEKNSYSLRNNNKIN